MVSEHPWSNTLLQLHEQAHNKQSLPSELSTHAQGLWVHGNLLTRLPDSIGALSSLQALSAVGNQLTALPDSIGSLQSLTSLELAGNNLTELPESVGNLGTSIIQS